jgi:hypothetical protein
MTFHLWVIIGLLVLCVVFEMLMFQFREQRNLLRQEVAELKERIEWLKLQ